MKKISIIALLSIIAVLFAAVSPAFAQLGQTDFSSFTIQNVDTVDATVTVHFFADNGTQYTPNPLNASQTNPFTLTPGQSFEIYVPGIPADQLPNGRYSVMIESGAKVVTVANLIGSGNINFNGSYSGFSESAPVFYLPGVVFNYYGWYSLISVQNVGTGAADINLTITCQDGTQGTMTASGVAQYASHHFVLKETTPTGFTAGTHCNGSAVIDSANNIVVTDNQSVPTGGNTQSYSGVSAGSATVFIPALYNHYYGWSASLNIQKLGSGDTTVTVAYSDGSPSSTCELSDATPACLLYMPTEHPGYGYFGAQITNSAGAQLMAIANAANGSQAQTYNGVGGGTMSVGIPSVMKSYYNWNTSFTCQNVGSTTTSLHIVYDGFPGNAYDTTDLAPGATKEVVTALESFLPAGHQGGATVTANVASSQITCIVNFNNPYQMAHTVGDWSMSYNAFNK